MKEVGQLGCIFDGKVGALCEVGRHLRRSNQRAFLGSERWVESYLVYAIAKPDIPQSFAPVDGVLFGEARAIGVCRFSIEFWKNESVDLSSQALVCHDCEAIVKASHLLSNVKSGHG